MSNILKRSRYLEHDDVFSIHIPFNRNNATVDNREEQTHRERTIASEIIQTAKREAAHIVNEAVDKAKKVERETRETIDIWWREQREQDEQMRQQIKDEAYDAGYASGYEAGKAEGLNELEQQFSEVQQLIETAYTMRREVIQEAEPFLVELALDIAETVIRTEISRDSSAVLNIVRHALNECRDMRTVSIYVHPEHVTAVHNARHELEQLFDPHVELRVLPDNSLTRDSCIIRTEKGSIDASVEVQLNQIRDVLVEVAKEGDGADDSSTGQVSESTR